MTSCPIHYPGEKHIAGERIAWRRIIVLGLVLVVFTIAAYLPAVKAGFIWDDDDYVTNNQHLFSLPGLARIWFDFSATPQYYPLVYTSFCFEYRLWRLNPAGYHVVNILLHALGALLLWRLLAQLRLPGAWLAAAIFALHPVHVESVAWITERKNVLSCIFYLASAIAYLKYALEPGENETSHTRYLWYALALILFIAALLSKTVTCTLPAALLVVLWWKRDRLTLRDVRSLIPMFVLSAAAAIITARVEYHHVGAVGDDWSMSIIERFLLAGRITWFYVVKLLWPYPLTFVYPRWLIDSGSWWQYIYPAMLILIVFKLWRQRDSIGKGPLVAGLFYIITLSPTMGFINVYYMRYSFVADHFAYLPSIGLIVLAVAAGVWAVKKYAPMLQRGLPASAVCILAALVVLTWRQARAYTDQEALWKDTLSKNPDAWIAHTNLAVVLIKQKRYEEAIQHCNKAIEFEPACAKAYNNRGNARFSIGDHDGALADYAQAIQYDPNNVLAYYNRGTIRKVNGLLDKAIADFSKVVALAPHFAKVYGDRADAYVKLRRLGPALQDLDQLIKLQPRSASAYYARGKTFAWLGNYKRAIEDCNRAVELDSALIDAYNVRAVAHIALMNYSQAIKDCSVVIRFNPEYAMAYNNRAVAYFRIQQYDEARADVAKCQQLGGKIAPQLLQAISEATSQPG